MPKENRRLFETDRKMELRLRLAAKKAAVQAQANGSVAIEMEPLPERQVLDRLIERVLSL
jgi:hypothetical protein